MIHTSVIQKYHILSEYAHKILFTMTPQKLPTLESSILCAGCQTIKYAVV